MPPVLGQIDFNNPANWGRLVQKSRDGRIEKYERNFGNGYRVFNFVIRAE